MSIQLVSDVGNDGYNNSLSYAAIDSPSYAGAPGLGKYFELKIISCYENMFSYRNPPITFFKLSIYFILKLPLPVGPRRLQSLLLQLHEIRFLIE